MPTDETAQQDTQENKPYKTLREMQLEEADMVIEITNKVAREVDIAMTTPEMRLLALHAALNYPRG